MPRQKAGSIANNLRTLHRHLELLLKAKLLVSNLQEIDGSSISLDRILAQQRVDPHKLALLLLIGLPQDVSHGLHVLDILGIHEPDVALPGEEDYLQPVHDVASIFDLVVQGLFF